MKQMMMYKHFVLQMESAEWVHSFFLIGADAVVVKCAVGLQVGFEYVAEFDNWSVGWSGS